MPLSFLSSTRKAFFIRLLGAIALLAIAACLALPNYVTGDWTWTKEPRVPHQSQLKDLKDQGLALPDWQTTEQYDAEISGHGWSVQGVVPGDATLPHGDPDGIISLDNPVVLLLRPQTWYRDMPQVEWMDINGVQNWTTDHRSQLRFAVSPNGDLQDTARGNRPIHVSTRFFRGWSRQQTYAVLQWYAWPTGGSPSASRWFWADQKAQLRDRHRMPWVAVSLLIPIKPLGDIQTVRPLAETLCQHVQTALLQTVFSDPS